MNVDNAVLLMRIASCLSVRCEQAAIGVRLELGSQRRRTQPRHVAVAEREATLPRQFTPTYLSCLRLLLYRSIDHRVCLISSVPLRAAIIAHIQKSAIFPSLSVDPCSAVHRGCSRRIQRKTRDHRRSNIYQVHNAASTLYSIRGSCRLSYARLHLYNT